MIEVSEFKSKSYACYQCGICTGVCPMVRLSDSFRPRSIVLGAQNDRIEELAKNESLWLCATCYCCYENCPQKVNVTELITDLKKEAVKHGNVPLEINENKCIGCANCEYVCPSGAIKVDIQEGVSKSIPELCLSCGSCSVECPADAITMRNFSDEQIKKMIKEGLASLPRNEPRIIAFICNWWAHAGTDSLSPEKSRYPQNTKVIRVICSGRIDPTFIYHAFLLGADGIFVGGCKIGGCYYVSGNANAEKRIKKIKKQIEEVGLGPERLKLMWISADERQRLGEMLAEFTNELRKLGLSPLKKR